MTQPDPTPNTNVDIQSLVIQDVQARREHGIQTYGTPLQAHNGRDALQDAYEEALDLCMYLRQAIEERDGGIVSDPQPYGVISEKHRAIYRRIRYGEDRPVEHDSTCDDCGVKTWEFHDWGCDAEPCPRCNGQIVSCGCMVTILAGDTEQIEISHE